MSNKVVRKVTTVLLKQECTNRGNEVAMATEFCKVAPSNYGSLLLNLLCVIRLAPRILRCPVFLESFCIPGLKG